MFVLDTYHVIVEVMHMGTPTYFAITVTILGRMGVRWQCNPHFHICSDWWRFRWRENCLHFLNKWKLLPATYSTSIFFPNALRHCRLWSQCSRGGRLRISCLTVGAMFFWTLEFALNWGCWALISYIAVCPIWRKPVFTVQFLIFINSLKWAKTHIMWLNWHPHLHDQLAASAVETGHTRITQFVLMNSETER